MAVPFGFIPQLDALAQASLFICHGGIASIHESLLAGVPMLVYSGGAMDEDGNAARVAFHGAGLLGDLQGDSAVDIRASIERALRDPSLAENVTTMRRTLKGYDEQDAFGGAVEALLHGRR